MSHLLGSIYFVRLCLETYYNYRLSRQQSHLDTLQKQRDTIITKLKAATRYDTTQQLLDKYGGPPARPKQKSPSTNPRKPSSSENKLPSTGPQAGRQRILPPPTANIPRQPSSSHSAVPASAPNTPNRSTPLSPGTSPNNPPLTAAAATPPWSSQHSPSLSPDDSASFAPNAFPAQSHYPPTYSDAAAGGKWYDRLLDVLLGEDETNAKNRLALICRKCRLVNGQAPPGVKRVEDVGRWRCAGCGVMNGEEREEDEVGRLVERIKGREMGEEKEGGNLVEEEGNEGGKTGGEDVREGKMEEEESDVTQYSEDEMEAREKSKSRRKGRKKG
ncbi:hypothetical protein MMC10_000378 [Thelotrema lepadinum]|nr:hypothetical protein [Thelotrema lepadinum]